MASVGIAVEPPLLADLLVRLLWTPDRPVHRHNPSDAPARHTCDVAITSSCLEGTVTAPVAIRLPDDEGRGGWGSVVSGDQSSVVSIRSVDDLIALLDLFVPG